MEMSAGYNMVKSSFLSQKKNSELDFDLSFAQPTALSYTSISLKQVLKNNFRIEASSFNLELEAAIQKVKSNTYGYINLLGDDGLIDSAAYPGRFKRTYVSKKNGVPFFLPSQLTDIFPKPTKFIFVENDSPLTDELKIKKNQLLMTRSGTIGNCSISSRTTYNQLYSDDVIRINFKGNFDLGFCYAFFNTEIGKLLIRANKYGAVIKHIEPEHLAGVVIPNAPEEMKKEIHDLIIDSFELRDQSNELIIEAETILSRELKLNSLEDMTVLYYKDKDNLKNYTVKLSGTKARLDASYHIPIVDSILKHLEKNAKEVTNIGNHRISSKIVLPGRFKRTYVEKGFGAPFFGGRQLYELSPSEIKYLSLSQHDKRIQEQLYLDENMVLITRSGTIGKINIAPKHWESWIINEHVIRVMASSQDIAGYLYCWLNTKYGEVLTTRHTYGAVVDEIDDLHVSQIEIPLLKNETKQYEINNMILKANELRHQAYLKERKAIEKMNKLLSNEL